MNKYISLYNNVLGTDDIAVLIEAEHLCVKSRGIGDQNYWYDNF